MQRLPVKNIVILAVLLAVAVGSVAFIFSTARQSYEQSMAQDSASHLTELGNQVGNVIGASIEHKWSDASVLQKLLSAEKVSGVDEVLPVLQETVSANGYADIYLYTDAGACIDSLGKPMNVDTASEMIYQAQSSGAYIKVVKSTVYYTVPATSNILVDGSPIVAISIVEDAGSVLDNMSIQSFSGQTSVYLVQANGLIVSRTSNGNASAINVSSLFSEGATRVLLGQSQTVQEALDTGSRSSFVYTVDGTSEYVATMPIDAQNVGWNVMLEAPETVVNAASLNYASYLSTMSVIMIAVIGLALALAMYYLYRESLKSYREAAAREQMLNLLISNTNSVFALLSVHRHDPLFVSDNVEDILGEGCWVTVDTDHSAHGLQLASTHTSVDTVLPRLNGELRQWDGKGEFTSTYLPISVNGSNRFVVVRAYASRAPGEYITMTQDVTREREREDALRNALSAADYANQAKSGFLSNMSHDIRTPMNAIVNMTEFALARAQDDPEMKGYLETIRTSSGHLLRLINEVLDMSRIESGKTVLEIEPFGLKRKLCEVEDIIRPICTQKGQTFTCSYSINHDWLEGDALKLGQVLINILNNASKFTDAGGSVDLKVDETGSLRAGTAVYRFTVSDTGAGIAPGDLKSIFDPFSRVDSRERRSVEGTGLGLSICKSFVDMMHGTISVESTVGEGSVFTVEIPFAVNTSYAPQPAEVHEPLAAPQHFDGVHALLVEDNAVNRQIAGMLLEKLGVQLSVADDGEQALKMLADQPSDAFDVVFMDIQMPGMNGYEVTRAFRASGHPRAKTLPIIAMTANVFAEDVEKAREAGMNAHVGKPIALQELANAMADVLGAS